MEDAVDDYVRLREDLGEGRRARFRTTIDGMLRTLVDGDESVESSSVVVLEDERGRILEMHQVAVDGAETTRRGLVVRA